MLKQQVYGFVQTVILFEYRFLHARDNGYKSFWNIDADDTYFCIESVRVYGMLQKVEEYAKKVDVRDKEEMIKKEYQEY